MTAVFDYVTFGVLISFFYLDQNDKWKYDCCKYLGSSFRNGRKIYGSYATFDTSTQSIFLGNVLLYQTKLWRWRLFCYGGSSHSITGDLQSVNISIQKRKSIVVKEDQ